MVGRDLRNALPALLPRLRRFGLALTGSAIDADELVRNTCEHVLRHVRELGEYSRVDAWAYATMRNLWNRQKQHRTVADRPAETAVGMNAGDGQTATVGDLPLAVVRRVFGGLPAEQRTVLMLVCVDGLGYKESAEALGIPIGTLMNRLSLARQDLHDRLKSDATRCP